MVALRVACLVIAALALGAAGQAPMIGVVPAGDYGASVTVLPAADGTIDACPPAGLIVTTGPFRVTSTVTTPLRIKLCSVEADSFIVDGSSMTVERLVINRSTFVCADTPADSGMACLGTTEEYVLTNGAQVERTRVGPLFTIGGDMLPDPPSAATGFRTGIRFHSLGAGVEVELRQVQVYMRPNAGTMIVYGIESRTSTTRPTVGRLVLAGCTVTVATRSTATETSLFGLRVFHQPFAGGVEITDTAMTVAAPTAKAIGVELRNSPKTPAFLLKRSNFTVLADRKALCVNFEGSDPFEVAALTVEDNRLTSRSISDGAGGLTVAPLLVPTASINGVIRRNVIHAASPAPGTVCSGFFFGGILGLQRGSTLDNAVAVTDNTVRVEGVYVRALWVVMASSAELTVSGNTIIATVPAADAVPMANATAVTIDSYYAGYAVPPTIAPFMHPITLRLTSNNIVVDAAQAVGVGVALAHTLKSLSLTGTRVTATCKQCSGFLLGDEATPFDAATVGAVANLSVTLHRSAAAVSDRNQAPEDGGTALAVHLAPGPAFALRTVNVVVLGSFGAVAGVKLVAPAALAVEESSVVMTLSESAQGIVVATPGDVTLTDVVVSVQAIRAAAVLVAPPAGSGSGGAFTVAASRITAQSTATGGIEFSGLVFNASAVGATPPYTAAVTNTTVQVVLTVLTASASVTAAAFVGPAVTAVNVTGCTVGVDANSGVEAYGLLAAASGPVLVTDTVVSLRFRFAPSRRSGGAILRAPSVAFAQSKVLIAYPESTPTPTGPQQHVGLGATAAGDITVRDVVLDIDGKTSPGTALLVGGTLLWFPPAMGAASPPSLPLRLVVDAAAVSVRSNSMSRGAVLQCGAVTVNGSSFVATRHSTSTPPMSVALEAEARTIVVKATTVRSQYGTALLVHRVDPPAGDTAPLPMRLLYLEGTEVRCSFLSAGAPALDVAGVHLTAGGAPDPGADAVSNATAVVVGCTLRNGGLLPHRDRVASPAAQALADAVFALRTTSFETLVVTQTTMVAGGVLIVDAPEPAGAREANITKVTAALLAGQPLLHLSGFTTGAAAGTSDPTAFNVLDNAVVGTPGFLQGRGEATLLAPQLVALSATRSGGTTAWTPSTVNVDGNVIRSADNTTAPRMAPIALVRANATTGTVFPTDLVIGCGNTISGTTAKARDVSGAVAGVSLSHYRFPRCTDSATASLTVSATASASTSRSVTESLSVTVSRTVRKGDGQCNLPLGVTVSPPSIGSAGLRTAPVTLRIAPAGNATMPSGAVLPVAWQTWVTSAVEASAEPLPGDPEETAGIEHYRSTVLDGKGAGFTTTTLLQRGRNVTALDLTLQPDTNLRVLQGERLVLRVAASAFACEGGEDLIVYIPVRPDVPAVVAAAEDTARVSAAAATATGVLGGASLLGDVQAMAVVFGLECGASGTKAQSRAARFVLAPVRFGDDEVGALGGSLLLLCAYLLVHGALVAGLYVVQRRVRKVGRERAKTPWEAHREPLFDWRDACTVLRFPSLVWTVLGLVQPGLGFYSFWLLLRGDIHPLALLGAAVATAHPIGLVLYLRRIAAPRLTTDVDTVLFYKYCDLWRTLPPADTLRGRALRFVVPIGRWGPHDPARRLAGPVRQYRPAWYFAAAERPLQAFGTAFVAALPIPGTGSAMCTAQLLLLAAGPLGLAVMAAVIKAGRIPALAGLRVVSGLVLCGVCLLTLLLTLLRGAQGDVPMLLLSLFSATQAVLSLVELAHRVVITVCERLLWAGDGKSHLWVCGVSHPHTGDEHDKDRLLRECQQDEELPTVLDRMNDILLAGPLAHARSPSADPLPAGSTPHMSHPASPGAPSASATGDGVAAALVLPPAAAAPAVTTAPTGRPKKAPKMLYTQPGVPRPSSRPRRASDPAL